MARALSTEMGARAVLVPLLAICIWLVCICLTAFDFVPALAMDCPVSGYDQVEKSVTDAPSCDAAMQLLMACQQGSSGDVGVALIVIKKCEGDFLAALSDSARRGYERKAGACGNNFAGQEGTLFQSVRAICAAELAHSYAMRATKAKK
jgi:hypothetical protein